MKTFRALMKVALIIGSAILLMLPGLFKSFFSQNWLPLALRMRKRWGTLSLYILGVQLEQSGTIPIDSPYIFIGNHRSYLDPIVALRNIEALPVAKAEVSNWPVIGYCAKVTGIMWVKRDSTSSRAETIKSMRKTLENGFSVLVYPEGTTHMDPLTHSFQRGAFRLAADMGIGVIPIAIAYREKTDAWVGEDTFGAHFTRCFGRKHTYIRVAYGPTIKGQDANEIMNRSKEWIDGWLADREQT